MRRRGAVDCAKQTARQRCPCPSTQPHREACGLVAAQARGARDQPRPARARRPENTRPRMLLGLMCSIPRCRHLWPPSGCPLHDPCTSSCVNWFIPRCLNLLCCTLHTTCLHQLHTKRCRTHRGFPNPRVPVEDSFHLRAHHSAAQRLRNATPKRQRPPPTTQNKRPARCACRRQPMPSPTQAQCKRPPRSALYFVPGSIALLCPLPAIRSSRDRSPSRAANGVNVG